MRKYFVELKERLLIAACPCEQQRTTQLVCVSVIVFI